MMRNIISRILFGIANLTLLFPLFAGNAPYMVVDLSGGVGADSYPISYLYDAPDSGWSDEYKTQKLVLRYVEAGDFLMRGKYSVRLSKGYYIGVFEVTQKQWELVTGECPSVYGGEMRPVENISYAEIRGRSLGACWPTNAYVDASSFLGLLRKKTKLIFDLPTEAQWEKSYAFTNLPANSPNDYLAVGRLSENVTDGRGECWEHTVVGMYPSTSLGIYDMWGNVEEWCLDWGGGTFQDGLVDPLGPSTGTSHVAKGYSWKDSATVCSLSGWRGYGPAFTKHESCGFRVAMNVASDVKHSVSLDANGGDVEISQLCESSGLCVDLPVPIKSGYSFMGWYTEKDGGGYFSPEVVVMDDIVLYAHWRNDNPVPDGDYEECIHGVTWSYRVTEGCAAITKCENAYGILEIPERLGQRPVVAIEWSAFQLSCGDLICVKIPSSITKISNSFVFYDCRKLESIQVSSENPEYFSYDGALYKKSNMELVACPPGKRQIVFAEGVREIGYASCEGCRLEQVIIPEGVWRLGGYAFSQCNYLRHITIPGSVNHIEYRAFLGCHALMDINVCDGNVRYYSDKGILYDQWQHCLVAAPGAISEAIIPNDITEIYECAFYECSNLTNVMASTSIEQIGQAAFHGCKALLSINLPNSLQMIGESAFYECENLKEVVIPDSVSEIGEFAFSYCSGLRYISLPVGLTRIERCTFQKCQNLAALVIPRNVSYVGKAFSGCAKLKRLIFDGNAPVEVSDDAFGSGLSSAGKELLLDMIIYAYRDTLGWPSTNLWQGVPFQYVERQKDGCSVVLDANGGESILDKKEIGQGTRIGVFPSPIRLGYDFVGWYDALIGGNKIDENWIVTADARLYAHWCGAAWTESDFLNCSPLDFSNEGESMWVRDVDISHDGIVSLRSGQIGNNMESKISTLVTNSGFIAFWWRTSCEPGDYVCVRVDGEEYGRISGNSDWTNLVFCVSGAGAHMIEWAYVKDEINLKDLHLPIISYVQELDDAVWLDEVNWTEYLPASTPIPDIGENPTVKEVQVALQGSADEKLVENILTAESYNAYRIWAGKVKDIKGEGVAGLQAVKDSPNAWLSYALDTEKLIATKPGQGDVEIEEFKPAKELGRYNFTVNVKNIGVGPGTLGDNLNKIFGVVGASTLADDAFTSDNVNVVFGVPENGKIKCTAELTDEPKNSFFMKIKMVP